MTKSFRLVQEFDIVDDYFGGDQMWFKSQYDVKTGCGPVALANTYAWFTQKPLSLADMKQLQEETLSYLQGPVLTPGKYIRGARKLFQSKGQKIESDSIIILGSGSVKRKEMTLFISKSLEDNRPVTLLLGPNNPRQELPHEEIYRKDFSSHWVLVTGLDVTGDDAVLYVSSWGKEFTLELSRLMKSKLILSCVSIKPLGKL